MKQRCLWANTSELLKKYHDEEWGKPLHDDRALFEMLILEGQSCGLSWEIILKKREHMRIVFDNFNPNILIKYDANKIESLMQDQGIIRHKLKIEAVINNAKSFLKVQELFGSFNHFLWNYVNNQPIVNETSTIITKSEISDTLCKDMKKLGFKFIGSTILYSFMQAVGMVDDHHPDCFIRQK